MFKIYNKKVLLVTGDFLEKFQKFEPTRTKTTHHMTIYDIKVYFLVNILCYSGFKQIIFCVTYPKY